LEESAVRKMRYLLATVVAMFLIAAVAIAQSTAVNEYTVDGSVTASGGTKKKPKPGGLSFLFTTKRADGTLPAPIQKYSIGFEGGKVNSKAVKAKCTAAQINSAGSDAPCSAKAKVGSGTVNSLVGTTGQPLSGAAKCQLSLTLYNGGNNHMPLFLKGGPPTCIAAISQSIDAVFVKKPGNIMALEFEVPESLRHQLGLDIAVVDVTSKINKIVTKIKKKKVGFLESVGCTDKKRDISVTFTDETGTAVQAKKTLAKC
jgi:hypothetical protein